MRVETVSYEWPERNRACGEKNRASGKCSYFTRTRWIVIVYMYTYHYLSICSKRLEIINTHFAGVVKNGETIIEYLPQYTAIHHYTAGDIALHATKKHHAVIKKT